MPKEINVKPSWIAIFHKPEKTYDSGNLFRVMGLAPFHPHCDPKSATTLGSVDICFSWLFSALFPAIRPRFLGNIHDIPGEIELELRKILLENSHKKQMSTEPRFQGKKTYQVGQTTPASTIFFSLLFIKVIGGSP